MFLPENMRDTTAEAQADARRKYAYCEIERWARELIPGSIRSGVEISVQEIQCGDPNCAPIDTALSILFPSGGSGMLGLPMEAHEVTRQILNESFPYEDILHRWANGEDAEWPPLEDDLANQLPELRFNLGAKVECRIGPDEITGWAKGTVIQLWYREEAWAEGSFAPYKILLDDGREIFAPGDVEMVIRAQR